MCFETSLAETLVAEAILYRLKPVPRLAARKTSILILTLDDRVCSIQSDPAVMMFMPNHLHSNFFFI